MAFSEKKAKDSVEKAALYRLKDGAPKWSENLKLKMVEAITGMTRREAIVDTLCAMAREFESEMANKSARPPDVLTDDYLKTCGYERAAQERILAPYMRMMNRSNGRTIYPDVRIKEAEQQDAQHA
ncbi:MAG: hypothetical protein AAGD43_04675 [Pseudomonadota bacterium]